jgi:choline dehydrogenase-like flavoprotein
MAIPSTDAVIVGAGACGSLVAKELASRGFSVVVLEAGRRFDPARDLPNAEANAAANVLRRVRSTANTTSSEWLAELGRAIRQVQHGSPVDPAVAADVDRIMQQVSGVRPKL